MSKPIIRQLCMSAKIMDWQEELSKESKAKLRLNEPLSVHTSFRIGGPADVFAEIMNLSQLKAIISFCRKRSIPLMIIGRGTNLLVNDEGYRGVVAHLRGDFTHIEFNESLHQICAGSAFRLSRLSKLSAEKGLSGLEFAFGIPGSLGGALLMNAGASCHSISEVVDKVEAIDQDGNEVLLTHDELEFGYRQSNLDRYFCITKACLQMKPLSADDVIEQTDRNFREKRLTQPLWAASAGCVFKNPPGLSAGKLIDECGLKGESVGGAQVSIQHANFIINSGNATASDVLRLIDKVRSVVKDHTGIELELELKVV